MRRPIKSARYTTYQGHQIRVNDGETTPQAVTRYRNQVAQEEADRLEAERLAKEEKLAARAQRHKTPRYADGTIVLTKDGEYFQVYDGYYSEYDDDIEYDAVPCTETGKWVTPRNDWEDLTINLYQKDIQRKVKEAKSFKVTASDEISVQVFDQLVDSYKDSGAGWSLIVAELKGTYGLDVAKEVADTVCYERKHKPVKASSRTFTKYPSNYKE